MNNILFFTIFYIIVYKYIYFENLNDKIFYLYNQDPNSIYIICNNNKCNKTNKIIFTMLLYAYAISYAIPNNIISIF